MIFKRATRLQSVILSLIICIITVGNCLMINQNSVYALTTSQVQSMLDAKMTQSGFRPGGSPPSSYEHYESCYGFCDTLCRYLFGHGLPSQGDNVYTLKSSAYLTQVGSTLSKSAGNLNEASIRSLFLQAQPGDIIQMDYTKSTGEDSRHTMMVYSVSSTGVVCYHAGSSAVYFGGMWTRNGSEMKWSTFTSYLYKSDDGISIYRSKNVTSAPVNTTPPTISNVSVSYNGSNGYTVSCTVTDNGGGISSVKFPTWTASNGQDDITWDTGTRSGNTWSYTVNRSAHNNELGYYFTHIYAYSNSNTQSSYGLSTPIATLETDSPSITNVRISNISSAGYTVMCDVSDSGSGIRNVKMPTWTLKNGQDDIIWHDATISGNTASYTVNTSNHNGERGNYATHIYAYDNCGNSISYAIPVIYVDNQVGLFTDSMKYNNHMYYLFDSSVTWDTAEAHAQSMGGHLVTINDAQENAAIFELINRNRLSCYLIGLRQDDNEGSWSWADGSSSTYRNWNVGEPSDSVGNENYAAIYSSSSPRYNGPGWCDEAGNGTCEFGHVGFIVELPTIPTPAQTSPSPSPSPSPSSVQNSTPAPSNRTDSSRVSVNYSTHVQNIGWQEYVYDGAMAGTEGQSLRLEAMSINVNSNLDLGIRYKTHVQNIGWQDWSYNGAVSGTSGRSLRLEAMKIELTGSAASDYDIYYRVHVQNIGWMNWVKNGETAGTEGRSLRLEGMQIKIVRKGASPNNVSYNTHVENVGWQNYVTDGIMAGTTGQSLRLEGIHINVSGLDGVGIEYKTHIQNIGWENSWTRNGGFSGTEGRSLRLEAIRIRLTGSNSNKYNVYYRTHVQNFGWTGWASNGASCGSAGYAYRLEGIEIIILPVGTPPPGSTSNTFYSA